MKISKALVLTGLILVIIISGSYHGAWAVGDPPTSGTIQGPDVWGVAVMDCTGTPDPASVTVRIKQIEDCDVFTEAQIILVPGACTANADQLLYYKWSVPFHKKDGTPIDGEPIIVKVKHPVLDGNIRSFDVLINFWVP